MLGGSLLLLSSGCTLLFDADWDQRLDPDGDDVHFPFDCDDRDAAVGETISMFRDADGDRYGSLDRRGNHCAADDGWTERAGDCDDADPAIHVEAAEICDGLDNDCDGIVDEWLDHRVRYPDADGDGWGEDIGRINTCVPLAGYVTVGGDCADTVPTINPGAVEVCDGVDNDCDGATDDGMTIPVWKDADGDGFGDPSLGGEQCTIPDGYAALGGDCDDDAAAVYPGAVEDCENGLDDNCDGRQDDDAFYPDIDGDGDGDMAATPVLCVAPSGWVLGAGDCDDTDAARSSRTTEICPDDIDNDCDGHVDDWIEWRDGDADGFGDPAGKRRHCVPQSGFVTNALDCLDTSSATPRLVDAATGHAGATGAFGDPFDSLTEAIATSASCIVVGPGVYAETLDLGDGPVAITSTEGPAVTVIDPGLWPCALASWPACSPTITVIGMSAVSIEGFTITGGSGYPIETVDGADTTWTLCGGAVYAEDADLLLANDRIVGVPLPDEDTSIDGTGALTTLTSAGGGLCVRGGTLDMTHVSIKTNHAVTGGGVYVDDGASVTTAQLVVEGNTAAEGAGVWMGESTFDGEQVRAWCNVSTGRGGGFFLGNGYATLAVAFADLAFDGVAGTDGPAEIDGVAGSIADLEDAIVFGGAGDATLGGKGAMRVTWTAVGDGGGATLGAGVATGDGVLITTAPLLTFTCNGDATDDSFVLSAGSSALDAGNPALTDADGTRADLGSNGGPGGVW